MPNSIGVDVSTLATKAAQAVIDANVDAILVDTGTTIPATISAVDTVVDANAVAVALLAEGQPIKVGYSTSQLSSASTSYVDGVDVTLSGLGAGNFYAWANASIWGGTANDVILCQLVVNGVVATDWRQHVIATGDFYNNTLVGGEVSDGEAVKIRFSRISGAGTVYMQNQAIWVQRVGVGV